MITIHYVEKGIHKRESFNVDSSEYLEVVKMLKDREYNWYTVDKGHIVHNEKQLELDL